MSGTDPSLFWLAFLSMNEQATRDWLTGLYNRRYFEETLADHIEAALRYGRELSLVLFDLDGFKQINDTEGHEAGDRVLRDFAVRLKTSARSADIVCRFGGDEFAVILPETSKANARVFAERVMQNGAPAATAGIAALPSENLKGDADADLLAGKRSK
jgi:diguanylate cyclase (GGDEF)-like protein